MVIWSQDNVWDSINMLSPFLWTGYSRVYISVSLEQFVTLYNFVYTSEQT